MKAKVKDTGEIIDVKFTTHPNPAVSETYWWCKDKQESYHSRELDFMDEERCEEKCKINWEQRRYEIAKDLMTTIFRSNKAYYKDILKQKLIPDFLTRQVVMFADTLIKELKNN